MNTLERVIKEQQNEIDGMKIVLASQLKSLNTVFKRNTELFEKFGEFLDAKIPDKTDESVWKRLAEIDDDIARLRQQHLMLRVDIQILLDKRKCSTTS